MSTFLKIALAIIMIVLPCLGYVQPVSGGENGLTHERSLLVDHSYLTEQVTFLKESHSLATAAKILLLLSFLTVVFRVFLRFRMKRYLFSFIPLFKRLYLLFPIRYESRYIALPRFIS
ncbi:hypothetical protein [Brevibacillus fluminis]|uniref:hypothetical protein n=1 Tax=Brevibacillus fluminis TaxID=511487 RepID=UPI0011CEA9E6|nr:hypothetical protein [Brevibacillus fluminis]